MMEIEFPLGKNVFAKKSERIKLKMFARVNFEPKHAIFPGKN
jgi:hypothetical protein